MCASLQDMHELDDVPAVPGRVLAAVPVFRLQQLQELSLMLRRSG